MQYDFKFARVRPQRKLRNDKSRTVLQEVWDHLKIVALIRGGYVRSGEKIKHGNWQRPIKFLRNYNNTIVLLGFQVKPALQDEEREHQQQQQEKSICFMRQLIGIHYAGQGPAGSVHLPITRDLFISVSCDL